MNDTTEFDAQASKPRRKIAKISPICRTCVRCRTKKAKCDGARPLCGSCAASGHLCKYPHDTRLTTRPSITEVESLRAELAHARQRLQELEPNEGQQGDTVSLQSPNSGGGTNFITLTSGGIDALGTSSSGLDQRSGRPLRCAASDHGVPSLTVVSGATTTTVVECAIVDTTETPSDDTDIACAIEEDGSIRVHGVSSYLHHPTIRKESSCKSSISLSSSAAAVQTVKDHLFANAAYQRQREASLLRNSGRALGHRIDFDGVSPELAIHLLELHWNRQHYAYLMTYRPAFIDSLANNGPYASKLLLNSLFFSSCCLDSDRPIFQSDVNEPRRRGERFYNRFKVLLIDEIDKPSLPTAVSLVVVGTTLISAGQQNAGWVLCGIAYRMIVDMGLHLSTTPWRANTVPATNLTAIEIEMRARVYWAAFMIDNYQSLYLGRPPYLRAGNARISREFFDFYEEEELWAPYIDPEEPLSAQNALLAAYEPRPIYAISTFQIFTVLGEIASSITDFYALDCLKCLAEQRLSTKRQIRAKLDAWQDNIPAHLRFDPLTDTPPPPNQFVVHVLYHTLTILLERPFLVNGHLSSTCDTFTQAVGQRRCTEAVFQIWHLLDAYQKAFTFRRTPYLLSYATYCAIVILLNQQLTEQRQYGECVRFFWFALLRIQKGTHYGLRKPLKILQGLMQRVGQTLPDSTSKERHHSHYQDSCAGQCEVHLDHDAHTTSTLDHTDTLPPVSPYTLDPELEAFLQQSNQFNEWAGKEWTDTVIDEFGQIDDSLFGLMDPCQPIMQGFNASYQ